MNNPITQLISIAKKGGNPMQLAQQIARSDPQMAQAIKMLDGKSPQQLRQMATNMCKEMGTTPEAFARQLGLF